MVAPCPPLLPAGVRPREAFTLVELLVVVGIISLLLVLLVPAFNGIKGGSEVTAATSEIAGLLEQARAYALSHSTYVFVGFVQVDAAVSESARPQTPASATASGRVAVAVVASRDGTRGYDVNNPGDGQTGSWVTNYSNYNGVTTPAANLVAISKLRRFENLHFLVDFPSWPLSSHPNSGMARSQPTSTSYVVGHSNCKSVTPFTWPLGSPLSSGYQYRFDKVINFDPQGIPRIQYASPPALVQRMEIDFLPTHGNAVPPAPASQDVGNMAALQIDGLTGATRLFRP